MGQSPLPQGKLPAEILQPLLDSMSTSGLPVSSRIGMDAGIVKIEGENIFSCTLVAYGSNPATGKKLVADLVDKCSKIGKLIVLNPVVLIPVGTSVESIRQVLIEI